jgi:signal transduction histidine kinase
MEEFIFIIDTDFVVRKVNRSFLVFSGKPLTEILGAKCYTLIYNRQCPIDCCPLQRMLQTKKFEWEQVYAANLNKWLYARVFPILVDARIVGCTYMVNDVTARKKLDADKQKFLFDLGERVKELDCLYELTDLMENPGVDIDQILYSAINIVPVGFRYPEKISCRIVLDNYQLQKDNFVQSQCVISAPIIISGQPAGNLEVYYLKEQDEDNFEFIDEEKAILNEAAKQLGRVIERFQISEKLHESEERFRTLVNNIPGVTYRCGCDQYWTMQFISEEIQNLSGYPAADFVANKARPYAAIIYSDDQRLWQEGISKAIAEKKPFELEYRIVDAVQNIHWVYEKGQGVFNEKGVLLWRDGAIFDITKRKLQEEELKNLYRELEHKNERLKELDNLKSEFVANVSHELRTPLVPMRESVSQIAEGLLGEINERQKKFLHIALRNIDRMIRLINDLLDMSKIEAGKMEFIKEPVDLASLAENVANSFLAQAVVKGLAIKGEFSAGLSPAYIDRDKITQVFTNLINNAIKFTEKGRIIVAIYPKGDYLECSITDTGCGIAAQELPRVFGKFEQFGRIKFGGTGLGLAISKSIIELHRGQISVESSLGQGTKFIFTLPKYTVDSLVFNQIDDYIDQARKNDNPLVLAVVKLTQSVKRNDSELAAKDLSEKFANEILKHPIFSAVKFFFSGRHEIIILADNVGGDFSRWKHLLVERGQAIANNFFDKAEDAIMYSYAVFPHDGDSASKLMNKARADYSLTQGKNS